MNENLCTVLSIAMKYIYMYKYMYIYMYVMGSVIIVLLKEKWRSTSMKLSRAAFKRNCVLKGSWKSLEVCVLISFNEL